MVNSVNLFDAQTDAVAIETLVIEILKVLPEQKTFLASALTTLSSEERLHLTRYLDYAHQQGLDMTYLASCYILIVRDTVQEQLYFMRNKRYRHSSYAEVAAAVYDNPDYMQRYMHGLAITAFFWPNHIAMRRYFESKLPLRPDGHYLEIGPGHGIFMTTAMRQGACADYLGVDISATSISLTERSIQYLGFGHLSYRLQQMDFLASDLPAAAYDMIVMGEVLEHVENPLAFLREIYRCAKPGAFIYVTTCMNSPAIDHIYLFTSAEELSEMVNQAGLRIQDQLLLPYHGTDLEQSRRQKLPVNIALILEKA